MNRRYNRPIQRRNPFDIDRLPLVTVATILWCSFVFLGMNYQSHLGDAALLRWGYVPEEGIYKGAFWGLITDAFVHIEPLHLIFNLYWFWFFGRAFERTFGSARLLLFIVVAAAVSSGLQLFEGSGIGLSGVGYALFGFGWVARVRYPEFTRILSQRTIAMFVIWAIACVYFTYAHVMNIGNVAHISGLVFGAAVAALMVKPAHRLAASIGLVLLVCGAVGALFWNPRSLYWVAKAAEKAEGQGDYAKAEALYLSTLRLDANPEWTWYNLAALYGKQGDSARFQRAIDELKRTDPEGAQYLYETYHKNLGSPPSSDVNSKDDVK